MASAKWTGYFKVVTPQPSATKMTDSQEMADAGSYNNYTWYQRLVQGSASRLTKYREYDLMDNDIEVARALDTIAEEMTGNNPKTKKPLLLDILTEDEDNVESVAVLTLNAALRRWGQMNDFPNKLYSIARLTIKYGDVFFRKGEKMNDKWLFVHPKHVVAAVVDEKDATKVLAWQIKRDINKPRTGGYAMPIAAKEDSQMETEIVPENQIIRFSLNDDMSDTQPFGESVLRTVYRSHKQKELLEDAVIIYRVQRAPERRVFYIDVGKMPPQRVKQYLEGIKNEIKQKKIPTIHGGQQEVDSVYNPHSMNEDFFFACLSMKTKVDLLDGRSLSINELREEYEDGIENWTCSVDQETCKLIPGKINWAGYTRRNAEMLRVYIDNGETLDVTPDHKFVLKDGSEMEAQFLTAEMSLMTLSSAIITLVNIDIDDIEVIKILKVEKLEHHEDTGCLYVIDVNNNHNFALSAGVYVKNSRPDGRGSKVDTLPGGQGLGELSDLEYFQRKVWRGLKVPVSYMTEQSEGGQIWNDGKVGISYIQELRFALYIERLQGQLEKALDSEFKDFLRKANIKIDDSMYRIILPEPSNFGKYRQLELDSQLLSAYTTPDGISYLSKRFAMKRYLMMTDEELIVNERLKREELGLDADSTNKEDLKIIYGNPEEAGMGGGGLGGGMGGGFGGAELGMGGEAESGPEGVDGGIPDGGPADGNGNPV